jgi:hypothetical protein
MPATLKAVYQTRARRDRDPDILKARQLLRDLKGTTLRKAKSDARKSP